ncbi:MAG TPA: hypothetical protein VKH37_04940 [Ferruginibacter sp.]|nr:hypothetical protein [Ferruginibacter sp.]
MKNFLFSALLLLITLTTFAQKNIDLPSLIGKAKFEVLDTLKSWGIEVSTNDPEGIYSGYKDGIQLQFHNDSLTTIWVEFTTRRTGKYPFQVDKIIKPNVTIQKVLAYLGKPNETGKGIPIGGLQLGDWMKWNRKKYQVHCEYKNSKVIMVTLMHPDWTPGG